MRRMVWLLIVVALMLMMLAPPAFAHPLAPCNDGTGDPEVVSVATGATGANYAAHHIAALAKAGGLGAGGHIPGSHQGFSVCNPSGK